MKRAQNRKPQDLRKVVIQKNFTKYAEGAVLISCGETRVVCTASVEEKVPPFLKNTGKGWITAEYGMLPRSTHTRMDREAKKGQSGRTQEIARLIGRALRSCVDLSQIGERQIVIDCDVIQADGGTRCASITGGFVALALAIKTLQKKKLIATTLKIKPVVAVSAGVTQKTPILDLDYNEDSSADVDMNFVINAELDFIEIQGTAEHRAFSFAEMTKMKNLAVKGAQELFKAQQKVLR